MTESELRTAATTMIGASVKDRDVNSIRALMTTT
jgi:hypothetical protein